MLDNDTTAHELSIGRMPTDRPSRYGKQIVSHLTRRATGQWSDETNAGTITFEDDAVVAELACEPDALTIALRGTRDLVPTFEAVIGDHLVRFGVRDVLVVSWTRSDGSPGTVQSNAAAG
jgi:uncharacterized protein